MKRRKYDSTLRKDHAGLTRNRIVEAIIEQLADASLTDFSVPRVAQRARVSEATVYRNFPNRESMLDAVARYWQENRQVPPLPTNPEETALHAERNFDFFERNAALARAFNEAKLLSTYRIHRSKVRGEATRQALAEVTSSLNQEEIERAVRVILHLDSSLTWKTLTEFGLSAGEATKAVVFAIRSIVAELGRMNQRAKRRRGSETIPRRRGRQPRTAARR